MTVQPATDIVRILAPRSIAVIGASDDTSKYGGRVIEHLIRHGYGGAILPINKSRSEIRGLPAFPSVAAAQRDVDVALIAVPEASLMAAVQDCTAAGVGCAIIITAGLAESGDEGRQRQAEIERLAHQAGMRLLGPNCLGLINPHHRLALTSSFAMSVPRLPQGGVALITQSGALMANMFSRACDSGIGLRACVSLGNQSDLGFEDFLAYFAHDDLTRAIVVYAEGIREPQRFFAASRTATQNGKFVLLCKAGATEAGSRSALSHTASLAGDHAAFEAACARHGILMTDDVEGAAASAGAIARWGVGHRRRIAVVSGSGGGVVTAVDYLGRRGFTCPELAASTRERLARYFDQPPQHAAVDVGALAPSLKGRESILAEILADVARDANVDGVVYVMTAQAKMLTTSQTVAAFAEASDKPVLLCLTVGDVASDVRRALRDAQSAFFDRLNDVAATFDLLCHEPPAPDDYLEAPPADAAPLQAHGDAHARVEMAALGIEVVEQRAVASLPDACAAAAALGYPVVLKAQCRGVVHKSDAGLVHLGLRDEDDLRRAWDALSAAASDAAVRDSVAGLVVQRQLEGGLEVFVGTKWDADCGALVMVGFGGIYVEVLEDVAVAAAPVSVAGATRLLKKLRLWPLLDGARGRARRDVDALARAVSAISLYAARKGPQLRELDVNPLIVKEAGEGAVLVDCRMRLAAAGGE
ncbi:MAG TPA: acetate--CoA ligase family protein [Burkholderiales bacterium]|nr:acetate--CoA ligase family protein [Burkholderiales bacterium]